MSLEEFIKSETDKMMNRLNKSKTTQRVIVSQQFDKLGMLSDDKTKILLSSGEEKDAVLAGDPNQIDNCINITSDKALIVNDFVYSLSDDPEGNVLVIQRSLAVDGDNQHSWYIKDISTPTLWKVDTYAICGVPFETGTDKIESVQFSNDGKHLFVGSALVNDDSDGLDIYWGYIKNFELGFNISMVPEIQGTITNGFRPLTIAEFDRVVDPPSLVLPGVLQQTGTTTLPTSGSSFSRSTTFTENTDPYFDNFFGAFPSFSGAFVFSIKSNGDPIIDFIGNYTDDKEEHKIFAVSGKVGSSTGFANWVFVEIGACPNGGAVHDGVCNFSGTQTESFTWGAIDIFGSMSNSAACSSNNSVSGGLAPNAFGPGCPVGWNFCTDGSSGDSFSSGSSGFASLSYITDGSNFSGGSISQCAPNIGPSFIFFALESTRSGLGIFSLDDIEAGGVVTSLITNTTGESFEAEFETIDSSIPPNFTGSTQKVTYNLVEFDDMGPIYNFPTAGFKAGFKSSGKHPVSPQESATVRTTDDGSNEWYVPTYMTFDSVVGISVAVAAVTNLQVFLGTFMPSGTPTAKSIDTHSFETLEEAAIPSVTRVKIRRWLQDFVVLTTFAEDLSEEGDVQNKLAFPIMDFTTRLEV